MGHMCKSLNQSPYPWVTQSWVECGILKLRSHALSAWHKLKIEAKKSQQGYFFSRVKTAVSTKEESQAPPPTPLLSSPWVTLVGAEWALPHRDTAYFLSSGQWGWANTSAEWWTWRTFVTLGVGVLHSMQNGASIPVGAHCVYLPALPTQAF